MAKVTANELKSFRPYHPGELLKDELEYRHISQKTLAKQLGLRDAELDEVLNGKRPVSADFALLMETALGVSPGLLLRMQTSYNLQVAAQSKPLANRHVQIRKAAAVPE
jgi:addiction module HigA family antidote